MQQQQGARGPYSGGRPPSSTLAYLQEVAVLAKCQSANITEYYASVLNKGSSELLIVMELMATSVADLVSTTHVLLHCALLPPTGPS